MADASPAETSTSERQKEEQDSLAPDDPDSGNSSDEASDEEGIVPGGLSASKPIIEIFKDVINKVRNFDVKVENGPEKLRESVAKELEARKEDLSKRTADDQKNILHVIAETAGENKEKGVSNLAFLIKDLIRLHPNLAVEEDDENTTPLHRAIKKRAGRVVEYMSEALGDRLDEVIQIEDKMKNNCLHSAASEAKHKNGIIAGLIPLVRSPKSFGAKNIYKLTPMHIAMEYDNCSSKLPDIIESMITHWDLKYVALDEKHAALNVNVLGEEGDEYEERSVFRHCQWTRERAAKRDAKKDNPAVPQDVESGKRALNTKHPHDPEKLNTVVTQPAKPSVPRPTPNSNQAYVPAVAKDNDLKALYPHGPLRRNTAPDNEAQSPQQDPASSKKEKNPSKLMD